MGEHLIGEEEYGFQRQQNDRVPHKSKALNILIHEKGLM